MHYFNHVVCSYGPAVLAMGGIIKVIASFFFFRKGEEVAIELHRSRVPVDKDKQTKVFEFKKTSNRILGIEGASSSVWNWWFLAEALSPDKIVHGQVRELCYSNRWAVVTRTAKLNIWWRQQWAQLRACFLEFTTLLVCSENGSHASIPSSRAPEPNFSRVRLFPNVLTIV